MTIPTPAKSHIVEHLQKLGELEAGQAVYYCVVRPGGAKDETVRVSFGDSEAATTLDAFARLWKQDPLIRDGDRDTWLVGRGALVGSKDGIRTLPGVRANRVSAKAQLKDTFKALRASLKDEGVATTALQKVIDGEFGTTAQYTTWARTAGQTAEGSLDETETEAVKDTKSTRVIALVNSFKKVGFKAAIEAYAAAKDERAKQSAREDLEKLATALEALVDGSVAARKTLVGRVLGKSRYKDSLATLDDLDARLRVAQNEVQKALGLAFEGADLTGRSDAATSDPILKTLRALLAKARTAPDSAKVGVLAEIYFAADYWLKAAGVGQAGRKFSDEIDKEMRAQVEEFYTKAATRLAKEAKVGINVLPAWLEKHYGKGMEKHGTELDVEKGLAKWMTADQRDLFRVHIKGGKLYQYDWWTWPEEYREFELGEMKLVPADSSMYPSQQITAGFTGFVLSMGGDLYITHQHAVSQKLGEQRSVFHSSYMAGLPIRMAGELKITAGAVEVVNPRSGHYRPPVAMIVNFVKHMQMLGVKIGAVMPDPKSATLMPVDKFLEKYGALQPNPDDFEKNDQAMSLFRQNLQFEALGLEGRRAVAKAEAPIGTLEKLNDEIRKVRVAEAKGEASTWAIAECAQDAIKAVSLSEAVERALVHVQERIEDLERKLAERKKSHDELVKKDATPQVERQDGYVNTLNATLKPLKAIAERGALAIAQARNPAPIVLDPK